jgi:4-amino-4-deoxy-L-arabinose transferase-like glycosyltransferase
MFLLSALVPVLAWRVALRLMSRPAAAITAVLCAFWPLFITYGGYFLSEIPSIVFLLLTIWLSMRARESTDRRGWLLAAAAGVAAGMSLAIRPQLVLNVAIAAVVMLVANERRARLATAAAIGLVIPVVAVLALNSSAAGRFVGFSENGGLNFFQGHCPVNTVTTGNPKIGFLTFASPVAVENHRGRDYVFPAHLAWEQSYFIHQGLRCVRHDGFGEFEVIARNVADLGVTSVPWPMSADHGLRRFVRPANLAYSVAIPSVIVAAIYVARRRRRSTGTWILVAHLLAVLPTALVFYGDPRFRVPYDVFGLALIAILAAEVLARGETDIPEGGRSPGGAR